MTPNHRESGHAMLADDKNRAEASQALRSLGATQGSLGRPLGSGL